MSLKLPPRLINAFALSSIQSLKRKRYNLIYFVSGRGFLGKSLPSLSDLTALIYLHVNKHVAIVKSSPLLDYSTVFILISLSQMTPDQCNSK